MRERREAAGDAVNLQLFEGGEYPRRSRVEVVKELGGDSRCVEDNEGLKVGKALRSEDLPVGDAVLDAKDAD